MSGWTTNGVRTVMQGIHLTANNLKGPGTPVPVEGWRRAEWPAALPLKLAEQGTLVQTRPGQPLPLSLGGEETVFVVRAATLLFRLKMADDRRQGVALLYPGDVFRSAFAPAGPAAQLISLTSGEVLRYRYDAFAKFMSTDLEARSYFDQAVARQTARQAIHLAAVGQLDSSQRLVTFLVELATQIGVPASEGRVVFEMPLSRGEVAEYLGLNADTLSRIMSRLRSQGLLTQPDRHTIFVRDLEALAALTSASAPLLALPRMTSKPVATQ